MPPRREPGDRDRRAGGGSRVLAFASSPGCPSQRPQPRPGCETGLTPWRRKKQVAEGRGSTATRRLAGEVQGLGQAREQAITQVDFLRVLKRTCKDKPCGGRWLAGMFQRSGSRGGRGGRCLPPHHLFLNAMPCCAMPCIPSFWQSRASEKALEFPFMPVALMGQKPQTNRRKSTSPLFRGKPRTRAESCRPVHFCNMSLHARCRSWCLHPATAPASHQITKLPWCRKSVDGARLPTASNTRGPSSPRQLGSAVCLAEQRQGCLSEPMLLPRQLMRERDYTVSSHGTPPPTRIILGCRSACSNPSYYVRSHVTAPLLWQRRGTPQLSRLWELSRALPEPT